MIYESFADIQFGVSLPFVPACNFKSIWIIYLLGETIAKHSSRRSSLRRQLSQSWDSSKIHLVWQWQFRARLESIKWNIKHRPIKCKISMFKDRANCRRDGDRYQKQLSTVIVCMNATDEFNDSIAVAWKIHQVQLNSIISWIWSFGKLESQVDAHRRPIARWIIMTSWFSCGQRKASKTSPEVRKSENVIIYLRCVLMNLMFVRCVCRNSFNTFLLFILMYMFIRRVCLLSTE